jgi:hypothetical protein
MNKNLNGLYPEMLLYELRSMKNGYIQKIKISIFVGNILQGTVSFNGHSLRLQASMITGSIFYRAHASKLIITELYTHTYIYIHIHTHIYIYRVIHKSLRDFRPLRYSSRDGHAEEEHVNKEREKLKVSVLLYRYSTAPFCCVCLGCCAAEFGISRGTYELANIYDYKHTGTSSE